MLRYFYLLRGTPARWMPIFAWVAIDIVLWGFITKYLNSVTSSGLNFVPTLLGAVLLFDFFTRVMHGVAGVFLEDVWSRNFLNLFASPLTIPQYLLGLVVTSTVTSLIGLLVMLVLATVLFGLSFFAYGLTLVPFLLILFLFGVSLGICTGRRGAPVGTVSRMAGVASPGSRIAVCRSLLPNLDPASMDAVCREVAARLVRVRRAEKDHFRGHCAGNLANLGRGPGRGIRPSGMLVFQARLSPRRANWHPRPV